MPTLQLKLDLRILLFIYISWNSSSELPEQSSIYTYNYNYTYTCILTQIYSGFTTKLFNMDLTYYHKQVHLICIITSRYLE